MEYKSKGSKKPINVYSYMDLFIENYPSVHLPIGRHLHKAFSMKIKKMREKLTWYTPLYKNEQF